MTWSQFKTYLPHSVVSLVKTLYGTFPRLMASTSSFKFQSYLYFKWMAISWYLRKQIGVIAYLMYYHLHCFFASQEDKYRDKINKIANADFLKRPKEIAGFKKLICNCILCEHLHCDTLYEICINICLKSTQYNQSNIHTWASLNQTNSFITAHFFQFLGSWSSSIL